MLYCYIVIYESFNQTHSLIISLPGVDVEGLYRVSGFSDEIEMCRMVFERGKFICCLI